MLHLCPLICNLDITQTRWSKVCCDVLLIEELATLSLILTQASFVASISTIHQAVVESQSQFDNFLTPVAGGNYLIGVVIGSTISLVSFSALIYIGVREARKLWVVLRDIEKRSRWPHENIGDLYGHGTDCFHTRIFASKANPFIKNSSQGGLCSGNWGHREQKLDNALKLSLRPLAIRLPRQWREIF